jgi:hypothetical protein
MWMAIYVGTINSVMCLMNYTSARPSSKAGGLVLITPTFMLHRFRSSTDVTLSLFLFYFIFANNLLVKQVRVLYTLNVSDVSSKFPFAFLFVIANLTIFHAQYAVRL